MKRILLSALLLTLTAPIQAQLPGLKVTQSGVLPELAAIANAVEDPAPSAADIQGNLITAPERVPEGRTFVARIKGDIPWSIKPAETIAIELLDRQGNVVLLVTAAKADITISVSHQVVHPTAEEVAAAPLDDKGKFRDWLASHARDEIYQDSHTVRVASGPDPGPDPPGPDPPPDPDDKPPFPADGLHVLIVFETLDATRLTEDQRLIIQGGDVREFLKATCPVGPDGKTRTFRIYDADADVSSDQQVWKAAMGVDRKSLPWLVVSNGKTGFSGPLDMSPEKFKELIQRYAK